MGDGQRTRFLVYQLELRSASRLHSAFALVSDCGGVASCAVEPEGLRLRFLAPRPEAERLVERIYAEGGLSWCTRHALRDPRGAEGREPGEGARPARPTRP